MELKLCLWKCLALQLTWHPLELSSSGKQWAMVFILISASMPCLIHLFLQLLHRGLNFYHFNIHIIKKFFYNPLKALLVLYEAGQAPLGPLSGSNEVLHLVYLGLSTGAEGALVAKALAASALA